jgi:hypothetical protein
MSEAEEAEVASCDKFNGWFIFFAAASVVALALALFIRGKMNAKPKAGQTAYQPPWLVVLLFASISLWSLAPVAVYFLLFGVAVPDSTFGMTHAIACFQTIAAYPVQPVGFILLAVFFILFYDGKKFVKAWLPLVTAKKGKLREAAAGGELPQRTIVCYHSPAYGMGYIELIKYHNAAYQEGKEQRPRVVFVVIKGREEWVHTSAETEGVASSDIHIVHPIDDDPTAPFYATAIEAGSVDEVIVSPYFMAAPPIGTLVTPAAHVVPKVRAAMIEARRMLRVGGIIRVVDGLVPALCLEGDIRSVGGFDVATTKALGVAAQTLPIGKGLQFECIATKADASTVGRLSEASAAAREADVAAANVQGGAEDALLLVPADERDEETGGDDLVSGTAVHYALQLAIFVVLVLLSAVLAKPLNVPMMIQADSRVNGLVASIAIGYPIIAYFSRELGKAKSLRAVVRSEAAVVAGSIVLAAFSWLPDFVVLVALDSTSLDTATKMYLSKALMVVIGIVLYKVLSKGKDKKTLIAHGADLDAFAALSV